MHGFIREVRAGAGRRGVEEAGGAERSSGVFIAGESEFII